MKANSAFHSFILIFASITLFLTNSTALGGQNDFGKMNDEILTLLFNQEFDQLEKKIDEIEKNYESDFLLERPVDLAFDTFNRNNPKFDSLLSNWVKAKPNSYIAYTARGIYFTKSGWSKRGGRYIDQTSQKQLDGMTYFFQKALKDFETARLLNSKMLHPLCYEIEILMSYSEKNRIRELYEEALRINPMSLTARWYYISTLRPRWGGEISEIEEEVNKARPYYVKNPALKILDGRVDAELSDQAYFRDDYSVAEKYITKALMHGEHWYYIGQRGDIYSQMGLFEKSNMDLDAALRLRPNFERVITVSGFNKYAIGKYEEAISIFSQIIIDNPDDHKSIDLRGDCYRRLGKLALAEADFEQAVSLDPANSEYLADLDRVRKMMKSRI